MEAEESPGGASDQPLVFDPTFRMPDDKLGIELVITGAAVALILLTAYSVIEWFRRKP